MEKSKLQIVKSAFAKHLESEAHEERVKQLALCPIFRDVISETLKNEPLTNQHLTGLIQLFKWGCSRNSWDKYISINVNDSKVREKLTNRFFEIGVSGYTGAGKASINGLTKKQLKRVAAMLENAFGVKTVDEAKQLVIEFEKNNIPFVKDGVYSPWLHYIHPDIFPVYNNKAKDIAKWLIGSQKYEDVIVGFNSVLKEIGVKDYGILDKFTYEFDVPEKNSDITKKKTEEKMPSIDYPLNQILYGPPGTGKTYQTINLAMQIVEPEFYEMHKHDRLRLRERFNELLIKDWENMDSGQIAFTTFHQSMSYEDFVEGIKPFIPDIEAEVEEEQSHKEEVLAYHIQDGIFKKICIKAMNPPVSRFNFDKAWSDFLSHLNNSKDEVIFKSTMSELKLEKNPSNDQSVKLRYLKSGDEPERESKHVFYVAKDSIRKIFNSRLDITDPNVRKWVEVRNIVGGGRATTSYAVYRSFFEFHNLEKVFKAPDTSGNYVLIIDEISRGNVSQILGELITLIETDKREGQSEALEVVLPYSKKRFSVPSNLYIIGTMNTADRSVEALDTALRRRFSFTEMMPDYHVLQDADGADLMVEDISLKILLKSINERLCYLLDEDHQIGHSFFLNVRNTADLRSVFKNNIIPQLKEFFYNDHSKIRLVLGEGFVQKIDPHQARPKFASEDEEGFVLEKSLYRIKEINEDFDILAAVRQVL